MSRGWLLVLLCAPLAAQDPQLTLMRARMVENLQRLPDYTCLETIERTRRLTEGGLQMTDRLRLEVALVNGKEMFAWPGSSQFEDALAQDLVDRGAFGFGNFALYARGVFARRGARFGPPETAPRDGRSLRRWDYRAPVEAGGIQVMVGEETALIGFHGAVFADPDTLDVVELEVVGDKAPERLGLTSERDTVHYARVPIGAESFLLPVSSELTMTLSGREDINRVSFSNCRKFTGESTIVFDPVDLAPQAAPPAAPPPLLALPANLKIELDLTGSISTATAAAGDAVRARLRQDLKWGKQVRVPRGAVAEGRITRMEAYPGRTIVGLAFQKLAWPGGRADLLLRFEGARGVDFLRSLRDVPLSYGIRREEAILTLPVERGTLGDGARLTWTTAP